MKTLWLLPAALVVAVLCGCPSPPPCDPEVDECDGGVGPPPDVCNSRQEALSDSQCEIVLGSDAGKLGFVGVAADGGVDFDWYVIKVGAVTARSLVHINAGYGVPATPVNLAVSVLKEDGTTNLARKIDQHGAGAPRPVDIIFPYGEANTKLLVLLSDEGAAQKPAVDNRNPYQVKAEVIDNPDQNEPNDVVPTDIPLTGASPLIGTAYGALATDDDVDKFSFTAPGGRKILYLHITGACATVGAATCNTRLMPEPPFRVGYTLIDPAGTPVAEGQAKNAFIPVDLATARLVTAGKYTLVITGYKPPNMTSVTPGDLRMIYKVDLQIMDDLDVNEPNDSIAAPKVVPMAYGSSTSFTGRLAYVPDPDVFALDLAGSANAGVLRYRLTVSPTAGRFPPLALASDRQLRIITEVTQGATVGDRQNNCKNPSPICPKGYEGSAAAQSLVEGLCTKLDPPWCTWAERNEDSLFKNLKNMVGAIPVTAHAGVARYYFFVQDDGNDYADDVEYTINFAYEADPDDTARAALPYQTQSTVISQNASFPVPAAPGEVTGTLSFGYGRVIDNQIDRGEGIRAGNDYDAVPNDFDRFEMTFAGVPAPMDRTWALQWDIFPGDGGSPPGMLALEVGFCTGPTAADGGCSSVERVLAYSGDTTGPWYSNVQSDRGHQWKLATAAGVTTITAEPLGCFCIEPRFMSTGHFTFKVGAVDRVSNEPINYRVRQSLAPYPQTYGVDGGTKSCPSGPDAGCKFAQ